MCRNSIFLFLISVSTVAATFDCRRPDQQCKNGAVCTHNSPNCTCPTGGTTYEGYDCGLEANTKDILDCSSNPCVPGQGVCYDDDGVDNDVAKCYCDMDHYGDSCGEQRFTVVCKSYYMVIGINPMGAFNGVAYITGKKGTPDCEATSVPATSPADNIPDDWKGYYIEIDHIHSTCGDAELNETEDNKVYTREIAIQYSTDYITTVDDMYSVSCEIALNGSVVSSRAAMIGPSLDNLNSVSRSETISPVTLGVTSNGDDITSTTVNVGDELRFDFVISPEYESMLILSGEATNNMHVDTKTLPIIENSCMHADALMITVQPPTRDGGNKRELSLYLKAFRFVGNDEVIFRFIVKVCLAANDAECDPVDCSSKRRRRRSAEDGTVVQKLVKIRDPFLNKEGTDVVEASCPVSREIIAVVILLSVITLVSVILCTALSVRFQLSRGTAKSSVASTKTRNWKIP